MILLIGLWKTLVISLSNLLGKISWIQVFPVVGVRSFGLNIFLLPKTLVLWKVFHGKLPTDQHIQHIKHKGLHICFMCTLCENQEEFI